MSLNRSFCQGNEGVWWPVLEPIYHCGHLVSPTDSLTVFPTGRSYIPRRKGREGEGRGGKQARKIKVWLLKTPVGGFRVCWLGFFSFSTFRDWFSPARLVLLDLVFQNQYIRENEEKEEKRHTVCRGVIWQNLERKRHRAETVWGKWMDDKGNI